MTRRAGRAPCRCDAVTTVCSNHRTDAYGGSIANRSRFLLELVEAMVSVWGSGRVAVRIGPSGIWNGMVDSDPRALFAYVADQLKRLTSLICTLSNHG